MQVRPQKQEYCVVSSETLMLLDDKVNEKMVDGWVVAGSLIRSGDGINACYVQTLVREYYV